MACAALLCVCVFTLLSVCSQLRAQQHSVHTVCARGFFMSEHHTCLPCNCKGHAHSCEDITGICIDCQNHSVGDFCEQCEDGYMLELLPDGQQECRPCACPLPLKSNNFAAHCDKRGSVLRCVCQEGYVGHYCERCAPGYYGNPMHLGSSCRKCECNGNSDPNLIFNECHNVTGRCLHCWGNTAGDHCERCAPGYYGDAIGAKDCRECQCNKCGTASCDDRTGVCHCKPGVTGHLCDECEEGYSGFGSCMGCRRCECAAAALKATCHPLTHTCQCHPGAGGRYCERCLPGHWDYSPSGCKKCDCPEGSCDMHTGECLPESSQISECSIDCDECIWHLIGDIRQSNKTLDQLRNSILNISTGAAANDRIKYYNYTAHRLKAEFVGWRNKSAMMRRDTGHLEEVTDTLLTDMGLLTQQVDGVASKGRLVDEETLHTSTLAEMLTANLTSLNDIIEDMISDWELYSIQQELDPDVQRMKLREAERMLDWIRSLDLSSKKPLTTHEASEAHQLLRQVRQMEKHLLGTEGRIPAVQEMLKRFTSKLSHGQTMLNRAQDTMQQSHATHSANEFKLHRREVLQQRLMQSYGVVNQTIMAANNIITETAVGHMELSAMVTNVSEHHAEVDGARALLQDKIDQLSQADRERVQKATDHAEELQRHAEELQHNLKGSDANGFVQKALDASNVYNNIVQFIDDANITSLTTLNLSSRAIDAIDGIKSQLDFLKIQSGNMFKESVTLHSEQKDVESNVADATMYIEETKEMMEMSLKKLSEIGEDMSGVQKGRTPARLQFTQEVAEGTLNCSAEVLGVVTPMKEWVEEWSQNMRNNQYSTAAYEQAIISAHSTVENLSEIVPELLTKLRVVEEKKAVNVSTNIMRIRELIAQARSVARKVQVSMKFNGQSAVEVHTPSNLDELKAVTSINLYVRVDPDKDPIEDRFLLYLGDKNGHKDYMGLAIKNDNLVYVYNLGGEDVEIPLSSKPVSSWPPVFNLVRVERLGRHGKVFLTVPSQDTVTGVHPEQKFIQKGEAGGTDSLFNLDPKDTVFIIGGVPPDVKLPPVLSLAPFVGCIELAALNNDVISLYNFKKLHKMDVAASVPCPRYKLAFSQGRVVSYLFDGTGYALINNIERRGKIGVFSRFDIEIRTVAKNGILFLMVNEGNFFVLKLRNGFLRLEYDFGFTGGPIVMESTVAKHQINDARYHEVSVIYHSSKKVILLVDRSLVKSMENERKPLPFSDIYIGGAPSSILQSRPELSSLVGLKGCVKGFQFQKKDFNLLEEPGTIGISSGCPEESFMSHQAYFSGEGYLSSSAKISPFSSFEGGLNFRTVEPSGLLFYHSKGEDEFSLYLENGAVVLHSRGTKVKSHKKKYNDGRSHFLVVSVNKQKYQLVVDDRDKQEQKSSDSSSSPGGPEDVKMFYYGGSPHSKVNFTGCISYAYISREDRDIDAEDFLRYTQHAKVSLEDCPVQRAQAALLSADRNTHSTNPSRRVARDNHGQLHGIQGLQGRPPSPPETETTRCYLSPRPRATRHAHQHEGSAHSHQENEGVHEVDKEKDRVVSYLFDGTGYALISNIERRGKIGVLSRFDIEIRTVAKNGILFLMVNEGNFFVLKLRNGFLRLEYDFGFAGGPAVMESTVAKHQINDARYREVSVIYHSSKKVILLVDRSHVKSMDNERKPLPFSDIYIGGAPSSILQSRPELSSLVGLKGCVKGFQFQKKDFNLLEEPGTIGISSGCPEELFMSRRVYFSGEGYLSSSANISLFSSFEGRLNFRTVEPSGLLFYHSEGEDEFSLYLENGTVVLDSRGTIVKSHKKSYNDGTTHVLVVSVNKEKYQLLVDDRDKQEQKSSDISSSPGGAEDVKMFYYGGSPHSKVSNFTGCISYAYISRQDRDTDAEDFLRYTQHGQVSLEDCPVQRA